MFEDSTVSPEEIRKIAERALALQRYILRRVWGLFYAICAMELSAVLLLPRIIQLLGFSANYGLAAQVAVNISVNIVGSAITLWVFKKVYDTLPIRQAIAKTRWVKTMRPAWALLIGITYYALTIAVTLFLRPNAATIMFALQATTIPFLYYGLKASFPEGLPLEGIAVFLFYSTSITASLAISLLGTRPALYGLFWGLTAIVFILASLRARSEKPPLSMEDPANW